MQELSFFKGKIVFIIGFAVAASLIAHAKDQNRPAMDEKTRAAIDSCITKNNLSTHESGVRPTKEQHKILKSCLSEQNIQLPRPPHERGIHPKDKPPRDEDPSRESKSNESNE